MASMWWVSQNDWTNTRGQVRSNHQSARRKHAATVYPEHDFFIQQTKLKNTLRWMMGEDQITHLGREYYQEE